METPEIFDLMSIKAFESIVCSFGFRTNKMTFGGPVAGNFIAPPGMVSNTVKLKIYSYGEKSLLEFYLKTFRHFWIQVFLNNL